VGDDSTADAAAIQRAIDELYSDTDQDDTRSRRVLFFPAGTYRIASTLTIPPYAHLVGEGPDKTIIRQSGANGPVAVTEDDDGNTYDVGGIGTASATTPTQITIEGITFQNAEAYAGFSIDCATKVRFVNCKFTGTYTAGGADNSNSKAITVRSTTALPCSDIIFDSCQFTKFARLVDFSYDLTSAKFINCDFSTAYYGVIIGEQLDGSTSGLTIGPKDIKILSSQFANIYANYFWTFKRKQNDRFR
jgi:polygalacturonase